MIAARWRELRRLLAASVPAQASAWYLAGSVLGKGLDLLFVPVFLALLTPDEYGRVAVFTTWLTLFSIVLTLRLEGSVGRAKFDRDAAAFQRYRSAVLVLGLLAGLIGLGALAILPAALTRQVFQLPREVVLLAAGGALTLFAIEMTWQAWLYDYRYRHYTLSGIGFSILKIALSIGLILLLPGRVAGVDGGLARSLGIVLGGVPLALILGGRTLARGRALFAPADWRYALAFSLPLIPHALAQLALFQLDRVLIAEYVGLAEAGVYSFAVLIGNTVFILWQNTNRAWMPWFFARLGADDRSAIRHRARHYVLGFAAVTAVLIVVLPALLGIVIPEAYRPGLRLIPILTFASFLMLPYSLYVNVEYYEKRTGLIALGTLIAAAANLSLNVLLIPRLGYAAAAWTSAISTGLLFVIHAGLVRFRLRRAGLFPFRLLVGVSLALLALALARASVEF